MPHTASYLGDLETRLSDSSYRGALSVMQTTGGMMSADMARQLPIRTLESGPAGGAGYGDPLERDPERVRWEVLNEILTPEQAETFYGVIIVANAQGDPAVNVEATKACRQRRRQRP
jgi:N-methylhydantoinase B/oxoprolinase/acetone carboxylase alpha subunit